jgi:diguanylate cyclase (GGDEF)-like protein/PAS domain S-box-containing protein
MVRKLLTNKDQLFGVKAMRTKIKELEAKEQTLVKTILINESLNAKILDALPINIFLEDEAGHTIFANEQTCKSHGTTLPELVGKTVYDFFPKEIAERNRKDDLIIWKERKLVTKEGTAGFKGQEYHMFTGKTIIHSEELNEDFMLGFGLDITARVNAEQQIEHMAYHDALTGLPNRWYIQSQLKQRISQMKDDDDIVGLLLLDLDHFKVINDCFGHETGDLLLKEVAKRLIKESDSRTIIGRLGGDEFILLIPGLNSQEEVCWISDHIKKTIESPFFIQGNTLNITASIGICTCPQDGNDINTLIKYADLAMYRSKEAGRNCSTVFNPLLQQSANRRMNMEMLLRNALDQNEFILHYQPKIDLNSGLLYGFEALIRWKNTDGTILYPDSFIQVAEETGLIVPIGEWVIREAAAQCKKWHDTGLTHLSVSVNLSPLQFQKQDLELIIASVLTETKLPASSLELELTEHMLMKEPEEAAIILHRLKSLGVKLSIDDFGTGFSSLSYLKMFPIDILKIDKSFIYNLENDEANATIALAVISLAHSLHLKVVAEGIETDEQMQFLQVGKCDYAQGYCISKPMEAELLEDFLLKSYQVI